MSFHDLARRRRCWPWFYTPVPAPPGSESKPDFIPPPPGPTTANMLFWFRGKAITGVLDGAQPSSWPDSSPTPHNMRFPGTNGGTKPVYKASVINGKPVVRISAGNQGDIPFPNFSPAITDKSFTFYWVGNYNNVQANNGVLLFCYATGGADVIRLALSFDIGGTNGLGYEYSVDGSTTDVFLAAGTSGTQILSFIFDKTAGSAKAYRNGTLVGSSSNVGGTGAGKGFNWGNDFVEFFGVGGGSQNVVGDHAELVGYQAAHDDATHAQTLAYLNGEYAVY